MLKHVKNAMPTDLVDCHSMALFDGGADFFKFNISLYLKRFKCRPSVCKEFLLK